jgi:hypothetical protein
MVLLGCIQTVLACYWLFNIIQIFQEAVYVCIGFAGIIFIIGYNIWLYWKQKDVSIFFCCTLGVVISALIAVNNYGILLAPTYLFLIYYIFGRKLGTYKLNNWKEFADAHISEDIVDRSKAFIGVLPFLILLVVNQLMDDGKVRSFYGVSIDMIPAYYILHVSLEFEIFLLTVKKAEKYLLQTINKEGRKEND